MFDIFWTIYPRKVAKKDALKAWSKLDADQQKKAIEVLPQHCRRWEDPQFTPHAASWLNGERFDDELSTIGFKGKAILPIEQQIPALKIVPKTAKDDAAAEDARKIMQEFKRQHRG